MKSKKQFFFQFGFLIIALLIIEAGLRTLGYAPGDLRPSWVWFQPVDSLVIIKDFCTNDEGLILANKEYWQTKNVFINSDGFRSREFSTLSPRKKKILFIGDSFTWGMSATPFPDSSFCDLLASDTNYTIINTGIPVADPLQYWSIANKYIPAIKPDLVLVMFYMGNDLMREERKLVPNNFYYWTNAGAIYTDIDGKHFTSAQAAYNYLANEKYFLCVQKNWLERWIARSALLSKLYAGKYRLQEKIASEKARLNSSISIKYLKQIVEVSNKMEIPCEIIIIPESQEADMQQNGYIHRYRNLLEDSRLAKSIKIPQSSKSWFCNKPNAHLNNLGHRSYFLFIKELIATKLDF